MSKELNKAPVEQAGEDERAAFEAWLAQAMSKKFEPEFDLAKYEDSGEYRYSPAAAYWKAWQARAALAKPSPAQAEQAEVERPEVVARVVHSNPVVLDQCAPLNANDELRRTAMAEELKPCPFCGCSMRLVSNHDWHRIVGDHSAECVFLDSETMMVPAIKDQREIAIADWNARAVPAGHVVVPRELLERLYSSDTATALMAAVELRAILYP